MAAAESLQYLTGVALAVAATTTIADDQTYLVLAATGYCYAYASGFSMLSSALPRGRARKWSRSTSKKPRAFRCRRKMLWCPICFVPF